MNLITRKNITLLTLSLVVITILILALTHSLLIVNSSNYATITTRQINKIDEKNHTGSIFELMPLGDYEITITDHRGSTQFQYRSTPFHIESKKIEPSLAAPSEAVSNIPMQNISVHGGSLFFVNQAEDSLEKASATGEKTKITSDLAYQVDWSGDNGIAVLSHEGDISSGYITSDGIQLGNTLSATMPSVAASKSYFYTIGDRYIIRKPVSGGDWSNFSPLYRDAILLDANDARTISLAPKSVNSRELIIGEKDISKLTAITIPFIESPDFTIQAKIAEDGSYVALANGGDITVLDKALKVRRLINGRSATSIAWLDSSTLLYAAKNFLYAYDIKTNTANAIGAVAEAKRIDEIQFIDDDYIYISTSSSGMSLIERVPRKKQQPNRIATLLGESNTTLLSDNCEISFINHNKITLYESGFYAGTDDCNQQVSDYLERLSIDKSAVNIRIIKD